MEKLSIALFSFIFIYLFILLFATKKEEKELHIFIYFLFFWRKEEGKKNYLSVVISRYLSVIMNLHTFGVLGNYWILSSSPILSPYVFQYFFFSSPPFAINKNKENFRKTKHFFFLLLFARSILRIENSFSAGVSFLLWSEAKRQGKISLYFRLTIFSSRKVHESSFSPERIKLHAPHTHTWRNLYTF